MNAGTFFDTRLPWYQVIMRQPVGWFSATEAETPTAPSIELEPADEDGVTEDIFRCYND